MHGRTINTNHIDLSRQAEHCDRLTPSHESQRQALLISQFPGAKKQLCSSSRCRASACAHHPQLSSLLHIAVLHQLWLDDSLFSEKESRQSAKNTSPTRSQNGCTCLSALLLLLAMSCLLLCHLCLPAALPTAETRAFRQDGLAHCTGRKTKQSH